VARGKQAGRDRCGRGTDPLRVGLWQHRAGQETRFWGETRRCRCVAASCLVRPRSPSSATARPYVACTDTSPSHGWRCTSPSRQPVRLGQPLGRQGRRPPPQPLGALVAPLPRPHRLHVWPPYVIFLPGICHPTRATPRPSRTDTPRLASPGLELVWSCEMAQGASLPPLVRPESFWLASHAAHSLSPRARRSSLMLPLHSSQRRPSSSRSASQSP